MIDRFSVVRKPAIGVYVGRPSALGNPFPLRGSVTRDEVCDAYESWFASKLLAGDKAVLAELDRIFEMGRDAPVKLVCYCAPMRCHADTIARFLNRKYSVDGAVN